MDHFSLIDFRIADASNSQILVLVTGNRMYKTILTRAFPDHFMSRAFDDIYSNFEWGTYIHGANPEMRQQVAALLNLCKQHVFIQDDLTETFALGYHTETTATGGWRYTPMRELVYGAKPYSRPVTAAHREKAADLAHAYAAFIAQHPSYSRATVVTAVPGRAEKSFDLPAELAGQIAVSCGKIDGRQYVQKVRQTRPVKDCKTEQEKINNVRNAFAVASDADLTDKDVILIDDIYQSGFTLNEVGRVLFEAGARSVFGLVATKTGRDL